MLLALIQQLLYAVKLQEIRIAHCVRFVFDTIFLSCLIEKDLYVFHCSVHSVKKVDEKTKKKEEKMNKRVFCQVNSFPIIHGLYCFNFTGSNQTYEIRKKTSLT